MMPLLMNWAFSAMVAISIAPGAGSVRQLSGTAREVIVAQNNDSVNNAADNAGNNGVTTPAPAIDGAVVFPSQDNDGTPGSESPLKDGAVVPLSPRNDAATEPAVPPNDGSIAFPDTVNDGTAKFPSDGSGGAAALPNAAKDSTASLRNPADQSDPADDYEGLAGQTVTNPQAPGELDPAQQLPKNLQQAPTADSGDSFDQQETPGESANQEIPPVSSPSKADSTQQRQPLTDSLDKTTASDAPSPRDELSEQQQPPSDDENQGAAPAASSPLQDNLSEEQRSPSDDLDQGLASDAPVSEDDDK